MYKCIPVDFGVDVSVNRSTFFHYNDVTHMVTDLGGGLVRITRKIDGLHELYQARLSDFTDINGEPVATTAEELSNYFKIQSRGVKAGEGVSVQNDTVSVAAGGPSTLGGFKVGTGLVVDGEGRLSASASSEVTKVLSNQSEMLGLVAEPLRPYRVIRLDTKRLYFLNAGTSPAVLSNWFEGPSIETTVLSFNGRTGAVDPAFNDYNFDLIPLTDKTTAATHKFVIDDDALYIENLTTSVRRQIGFSADFDFSSIQNQLTTLDDLVNNEISGLSKQVGDLKTSNTQISDAINNANTGLIARVEAIEAKPSTDYSLQIAALQQRDTAIEDLTLFVNQKVDSTAANTLVLDQRLQQAETKNSNQDFRLNTLTSSLNTKADLVQGKVPISQLPDIPVGRKVNVADRAARLSLPIYPDITIAYESDTGDAWGLDARANPAIDSNWSKLGNSVGVGVQSFNGRTGNISSQDGDYNAAQITETLTKQFVTPGQKVEWSAKETVQGSQAKADAAQAAAISSAASTSKAYADSTFLPISQKGAINGVAPLGSTGKVPAANLLTNAAGGVPLLDAEAKIDPVHIKTGTPSGVAPLGTASKVPMVHILSDVPGGLPVLDANARIEVARLPSNLPSAPREWRNNKAIRNVGTWAVNNHSSRNEMTVYARVVGTTSTTRELRGWVRKDSSSATFTFQSDAQDAGGNRWIHLYMTVPHGWQYQITTNGGSSNATIETWYELY